MGSFNLFQKEIDDEHIQENFRRLQYGLNDLALLKGQFKFFKFSFDTAAASKRIPHNLGFAPKDVLQTSVTNGASVTWEYDSFDRDYIYITTSAACDVRAFIGRYEEEAT